MTMLWGKRSRVQLLLLALTVTSPFALAERSGDAIYVKHCAVCHDDGVAGAQILGDATAWQSLKAKGLDALVQSTKVSITAMPPMGTCMDCTDDELTRTVQYMIEASQ